MLAHTLPSSIDRTVDRDAAAEKRFGIVRAEPGSHAAPRAADAPTPIDDLLVVLSPAEAHSDVAVRAQLLAQDAAVTRVTLAVAERPKWQRFLAFLAGRSRRSAARSADVSARVLRASFPPKRVHLATCADSAALVTQADAADMVLAGRRRAFPWSVAPLSGSIRRVLRRSRTPVLVVGSRPKGAYRNVVVATDLRADVGQALAWARRVAPHARCTLLHLVREPRKGRLGTLGRAASAMARLLDRHRHVEHAALAHGWAIQGVLGKARELRADLIVVVRSTRSWWADRVGASVSAEIASRADRDVLVVHGSPSHGSGMPEPGERRSQ